MSGGTVWAVDFWAADFWAVDFWAGGAAAVTGTPDFIIQAESETFTIAAESETFTVPVDPKEILA